MYRMRGSPQALAAWQKGSRRYTGASCERTCSRGGRVEVTQAMADRDRVADLSRETTSVRRRTRSILPSIVSSRIATVVAVSALLIGFVSGYIAHRTQPAAPAAAQTAPRTSPSPTQPRTVRVPYVLGLTRGHAAARLENYGFRLRIIPALSSAATSREVVLYQWPAATTTVPSGTTVILAVAQPQLPIAGQGTTVPNLIGLNTVQANQSLATAGLLLEVDPVGGKNALVLFQSPLAGTSAAPGSTVVVRASCFPAPCPSPGKGQTIFDPCTCASR